MIELRFVSIMCSVNLI